MKTRLLTLLLLLSSIAGGNAQNDNMDTPVCGGYRSNNHNTKPLENVKGELTSIYCNFYDDSAITTPTPNSLAGILDNVNGTLYLEPLQAAPDLPDRSKIKKTPTPSNQQARQ